MFVSNDQNQREFEEYMSSMPFHALPYGAPACARLSSTFSVRGIPTLVLLRKDGTLLTTGGVAAVMSDPTAAKFPYAGWAGAPSNGSQSITLVLAFLAAYLLWRYFT